MDACSEAGPDLAPFSIHGGEIMRKTLSLALGVFLLAAAASYAKDRPHEGKIVRVQTIEKSADVQGEKIANVENSMVVQGEKGDQWTLYWNESTKFKSGLMPSQLKQGDTVHFDFVSKDGKMWLT